MTNIDRETRSRKIVKELAKLDEFRADDLMNQIGFEMSMECTRLRNFQKPRKLTVPKELHVKFLAILTVYQADLLHELVELNKEATNEREDD